MASSKLKAPKRGHAEKSLWLETTSITKEVTDDGGFLHITKGWRCVHCSKEFWNKNLARVAYHLGGDEKFRDDSFNGCEVCTDVPDDVAKKLKIT